MLENSTQNSSLRMDLLTFLVGGVALTLFFWWPLAAGYGIIGGDIYTYYFPQKTFYSDWLHKGELPLWNNLVGFGYPMLGESQTGLFYPFHLLFYGLMSVNAAYNANHCLHTVIAFVGMGMLARVCGLNRSGAFLAATIYVFGWFPARSCLEWAIITGSWVPWQIWALLIYLKRGQIWGLIILAVITGVQLLAGHYNLAFICILTCLGLVVWGVGSRSNQGAIDEEKPDRRRAFGWTIAALLVGFLLAGVQLIPSYELKRGSQRAEAVASEKAAYGHLPPWYLLQTIAPFIYYDAYVDADALLGQPGPLTFPAATNKVEAHLYFGLVPLGLAVFGFIALIQRRNFTDEQDWLLWFWVIAGLLGLIYATGWLVPILKSVPGFSYFRGPGRYTMITTISVAIFAGWALDRLTKVFDEKSSIVFAVLMVSVSVFDLYVVGRNTLWMSGVKGVSFFQGNGTGYTTVLANTPLEYRDKSEIARLIERTDGPARVFAPGPNMVTSLGISATPTYLGIGPAVYEDEDFVMPSLDDEHRVVDGLMQTTPSQLKWMEKASVTHVISFDPLNPMQWPIEQSWTVNDQFLGRAWGRAEPIYLSKLSGYRPRLSWRDNLQINDQSATTITLQTYHPNHVDIETFISQPNFLIITDLAWPGWVATIDGSHVPIQTVEGVFRGIEIPQGKHILTLQYRPWSLWLGSLLSLLALVGIVLVSVDLMRRGRVDA